MRVLVSFVLQEQLVVLIFSCLDIWHLVPYLWVVVSDIFVFLHHQTWSLVGAFYSSTASLLSVFNCLVSFYIEENCVSIFANLVRYIFIVFHTTLNR